MQTSNPLSHRILNKSLLSTIWCGKLYAQLFTLETDYLPSYLDFQTANYMSANMRGANLEAANLKVN